MANDYEISRATGKCTATGRTFGENEFYYAALFESAEGFERRDYSMEAWSGPPEGCFCYWKARVPPREKKPSTIAIDNSVLMNLFCRLEDDTSPMRQKFRFVLALLLMRKRLLRFEQAIQNEAQEYWQVRVVQEQSVQQVLNPHLSEEEIERLSTQLTAILSGDVSAIARLEEDEATAESAAEPRADTDGQDGGVPAECVIAAVASGLVSPNAGAGGTMANPGDPADPAGTEDSEPSDSGAAVDGVGEGESSADA